MSTFPKGTFQKAFEAITHRTEQSQVPAEPSSDETSRISTPLPSGPSIAGALPTSVGETGSDLEYYFDKDRGYGIASILRMKQTGEWAGKAPSLTSIKTMSGGGIPSVPDIRPPPSPKVPKFTEMVTMFENAGLTAVASHTQAALPKMESASARWPRWITSDMNLSQETALLPFPLLGTEGDSMMYHQQRANMGHWNQPLTACRALAFRLHKSNSPLTQSIIDLMNELITMAKTHFFGTGSVQGQLGRLAKVLAVRHKTHFGEGTELGSMAPSTMAKMAALWWPMGPKPEGLDLHQFQSFLKGATQQVISQGQPTIFHPFKINASSDAGFPWESNSTRGQTLPGDLYLADSLASECQQLRDGAMPRETFADRWGWSVYSKMKAKAEVYKRDEINQKTRNIFVTQAGCMMPAQCFFRAATFTMPHYLTPESESLSLIGTNFLGGGMNHFFSKMLNGLKENGNLSMVFYSDNLFALIRPSWASGPIWVSLDGDKMEGSNSVQLVKGMLTLMLENISDAVPGWMRTYLSEWYCQAVVDREAIIGKAATRIPGMLSGVQGTAYVNNFHMALLVDAFVENGHPDIVIEEDGSLHPSFKDICERIGVIMKVESVVGPGFPGPTLKECFSNPHTPTHSGPIANTDLLGWSVCCFEYAGAPVWCAVLARDRLEKSLLFRKSQYRAIQRKEEAAHSVLGGYLLDLVAQKVLYVIGGWAYPDLGLLLRYMINDTLHAIESTIGTGEEAGDLQKLTGDMVSAMLDDLGAGGLDPTILHALADPRPATLEEALNVTLNHDITSHLLQWCKEHTTTSEELEVILTPDSIISLALTEHVEPSVLSRAQSLLKLRATLKSDISIRKADETSQPMLGGPVLQPGAIIPATSPMVATVTNKFIDEARRAASWLQHGDRDVNKERWSKLSSKSKKDAIRHVTAAVAAMNEQHLQDLKTVTPRGLSPVDTGVALLTLRYSIPWSVANSTRVMLEELLESSSEEETSEPPPKKGPAAPSMFPSTPSTSRDYEPVGESTIQISPPAPTPSSSDPRLAQRGRKRRVIA